jgi:rhodanese-related sulfurtransferase
MSTFKNVDIDHLDELRGKPGFRLIDVRTDEEVKQTGKIPGAEHIPLHTLAQAAGQFDPQKTTVFYCRSGNRSGQAAAFFANKGYGDVYNMTGGITAWLGAGKPVEK